MHANPFNLQCIAKYTQHFTKHGERKINALRFDVKGQTPVMRKGEETLTPWPHGKWHLNLVPGKEDD